MKTTTKSKAATKAATKKPGKAAAVASDGQVVAATPKKLKAAAAQFAADVIAEVPPKAAVKKLEGAIATKAAKAPKASPTATIRQLLAVDPAIEADALEAALAKQGLNPPRSTINTVRADFLGCLKALQAAGRVKLH